MFRFANPHLLWLLLAVPVMVVLLALAAHSRRRSLARFGNPALLDELMPDVSPVRMRIKSALALLAVAAIVLAAARPQFGSKLREQKGRGIEMMLVVDVSNSMLAEDFSPNRLDRTKYAIDRLFASLHQDRVGMVVFAGEPKVQLPITTDYRMARSFAKRLSPSLVPVQGTDLGSAISLATLSFSNDREVSRAMILITDGETHDERALDAARTAAGQGIRIFAIGIGTPEGAPVKIGGEFIRDQNGDMVVSKLDENILQEIVAAADGGYIRAGSSAFGLDEIVGKIGEMEQGELSTLRFEEFDEQYRLPLAAALALLLLDALLLGRRNPRLRRFDIFRSADR